MNAALDRKLENYLGVGVLLIVFTGCLLVVWPFVTALLWAAVLSYSTWPLYQRLLKRMGGRTTLAALLLSLAMILVVLLPFMVVGLTLADNVTELKAAAQRWFESGPPPPPAWLAKVPVIGHAVTERWQNLSAGNPRLGEEAKGLIEPVGSWLVKAGLKLSIGIFDMALSIVVMFFLLRHGPAVAANVTAGMGRIAGERGKHLLDVAGNTVRGVVYGILGTALVQALMAGVGFLIAGVPGTPLLALLTFFMSVVPFGPPLVWLPVAIWLFGQGNTGWGIFMLVWGAGVSTVDNFIKPWLISQSSDLPFLLILFGVLGGALAFGFIGVFIGPILLAVGYRLVKEWSAASRIAPADAKNAKAPAAGA